MRRTPWHSPYLGRALSSPGCRPRPSCARPASLGVAKGGAGIEESTDDGGVSVLEVLDVGQPHVPRQALQLLLARRPSTVAHPMPPLAQSLGPPATYRTCPLTNAASSEARYKIAAATSSGQPPRPTGISFTISSTNSSKSRPRRAAVSRVISVSIKPGATAFAVTP